MADNQTDENWDDPTNDIFPEAFFIEVQTDLELKKEMLAFASMDTPKIHNKYLRKYYRCKEKLEKIVEEHNQMLHGLEIYFSGRCDAQVYKEKPVGFEINTAKELSQAINGSPAYGKSNKRLQLWQNRVEFLKKVVETINNRSFHINNAIKMIKFENGEN